MEESKDMLSEVDKLLRIYFCFSVTREFQRILSLFSAQLAGKGGDFPVQTQWLEPHEQYIIL